MRFRTALGTGVGLPWDGLLGCERAVGSVPWIAGLHLNLIFLKQRGQDG